MKAISTPVLKKESTSRINWFPNSSPLVLCFRFHILLPSFIVILQTPNRLAAHLVTFRGVKNRFSDVMRQTLIELQWDGNIQANKCKTVIKTVANICSTGIWVIRIFSVSKQQSMLLTRLIF